MMVYALIFLRPKSAPMYFKHHYTLQQYSSSIHPVELVHTALHIRRALELQINVYDIHKRVCTVLQLFYVSKKLSTHKSGRGRKLLVFSTGTDLSAPDCM